MVEVEVEVVVVVVVEAVVMVIFYIFTIMACGYESKWRLHLVQPSIFNHTKHLIASKLT